MRCTQGLLSLTVRVEKVPWPSEQELLCNGFRDNATDDVTSHDAPGRLQMVFGGLCGTPQSDDVRDLLKNKCSRQILRETPEPSGVMNVVEEWA